MHPSFEHQFEWDSVKARLNYRKHGVTFERAAAVFHDPRALSFFDEEGKDYFCQEGNKKGNSTIPGGLSI